MIKKAISILLSVMFVVTAFILTACVNFVDSNGLEAIDPNRTQLYIGHYNGGYGNRWLTELKKRFEYKYKDRQFEADKTGVQVIIDNNKESFHGNKLKDTIEQSIYEVFFSEGINYYDFISKGQLYDISDIMTEKIEGEERSIEDKLSDLQISYLKQNGKYYGVPHYLALRGIIYDWDLFEERGLFIQADGSYGHYDGALSSGPDGNPDTLYDNGLPATYQEFFALCERMKVQESIVPISWTGEFIVTYTQYLLDALHIDYQGFDEMNIINNLGTVEGKDTSRILTSASAVSANVPQTVKINESNISLLRKQAGKYYALDFLDSIISNNYFSRRSIISTQKHVMAQADFLDSRFAYNTDPIAMLIDGIWWEEEANDTFKEMEELYLEDASRSVRKFGFMPMPKIDSNHLGGTTLYDGNNSMCFINGNITNPVKLEIAKLFVMFSCTEESLQEYNIITGVGRDMDYELSGEQKSQLSYFGQNVYELKNNNKGIFYSWNPSYVNYTKIKDLKLRQFNALINDKELLYPVNSLLYDRIGNERVNAETYFNSLIS